MAGLKVSIRWMPRIQAILEVSGEPQFVVVSYHDFVRIAALATAGEVPDVCAVLDAEGTHVHAALEWRSYRAFLWQFEMQGTVDEHAYLAQYDDVRAAVDRGEVASATEHYVRQGYFERRRVRLR
jgi:hypothetical protein